MKAAIHTRYGPPSVVQIQEVPKPVPKGNEVLIQVHASTINRTDSGFRTAEYVISRLFSGLFKPKQQTLGSEFAGIIEAIGPDVRNFKVGDQVFGYDDALFGGHAEYLALPETKAIVPIPHNLSLIESAAISEGAHYALCNIRASKISSGQKALVYGATGAIGSAAVQLLRYFGVIVTAVCNTKNVALVQSLGAHRVVDYQTTDFTQTDEKYDFVFDAVGKSSFGACKPLMTEKGIYVSTEFGKNAENVYLALILPLFGGKRVIFPIPKTDVQDLIFLKDLVEKGEFKPVIDREYRLDQIVEAYTYVETGQKTGNVLLRMI